MFTGAGLALASSELGCLWQQAGEALDSLSPPVRLNPRRLSSTGLGSCHKAAGPGIKCSFSTTVMKKHSEKQP